MGGGAEDANSAGGGVLDDGQDVEADTGQRQRFEEVGGDDGLGLRAQQRRPGVAGALRCRVYASLFENLPDRRCGDLDTEEEQFAVDPAVPPRAVLPGQAQNQPADGGITAFATNHARIRRRVEATPDRVAILWCGVLTGRIT